MFSLAAREKQAARRSEPSDEHALALAALRESEERIRAILHTAAEGIITINDQGLIDSVNPAAEKLFGYSTAELLGRNVNLLMPPPYHEEHDRYLANYRDQGRAKIIGIGREVVGRRKDGSVFPLNLSVGEVRLDGRRMFTGICSDITDRKRLENEILQISEREQHRLGQDLHDGLCQHLAGIEFMSQVLAQRLAAKSKADAASAAEIAKLVRSAISHTRDLARGLSPVVLESDGLMAALQDLAENTQQRFSLSCR